MTEPAYPGERFWLCVNPETVTGMRHHWEVAVSEPQVADADTSRAWLEALAKDAGLSYDAMMADVEDWIDTGDVKTQENDDSWLNAFYRIEMDDFWRHWEVITGKTRPDDDTLGWPIPYSCSC